MLIVITYSILDENDRVALFCVFDVLLDEKTSALSGKAR